VGLLAYVYKQQRSTDPKQTIASLEKIRNWEGVLGAHTADAEHNMVHTVSIGQINDGNFALVKTVTG
jgi:hypothetical protein